jgi:hypothetical protein
VLIEWNGAMSSRADVEPFDIDATCNHNGAFIHGINQETDPSDVKNFHAVPFIFGTRA